MTVDPAPRGRPPASSGQAPARQSRRRAPAVALGAVLLGALVLWRLAGGAPPAVEEFAGATMGTTFSVTVVAQMTPDERQRIGDRIEHLLARVNGLMSSYDPASEVSRLNAHSSTQPFQVSEDLLEVLELAQEVSARSGGAFDVTVAPLVHAWGFGAADPPAARPDPSLVAGLRRHVGYRLLALDEVARTVSKLDPAVVVDLSGIAKGYATELVAAELAELGYTDFLVEVGGELFARGAGREGPWRVGVEAPSPATPTLYGVVVLGDEAIATSGDYRDFYEDDDGAYAHIVDPRTGRPLPFVGALVSVVHPSGAAADAWATALVVLGPEAGYERARQEGIAALFVTSSDGAFESRATPSMSDRFRVLD